MMYRVFVVPAHAWVPWIEAVQLTVCVDDWWT